MVFLLIFSYSTRMRWYLWQMTMTNFCVIAACHSTMIDFYISSYRAYSVVVVNGMTTCFTILVYCRGWRHIRHSSTASHRRLAAIHAWRLPRLGDTCRDLSCFPFVTRWSDSPSPMRQSVSWARLIHSPRMKSETSRFYAISLTRLIASNCNWPTNQMIPRADLCVCKISRFPRA